ncbi:hypothetical protein HPB51_019282 [Rhipicephalus microplus]|uniref:Uncharacterized protein n=1 Tax=Rhipicephalus microplus TaxID=6941 RepID=A0A9J6EI88_RHIMP|nr:hypothetical protein HPB51_019282 [Rhipicephalus microplus]
MLWQCPVLNASFGSPATEDDWFNHLRSPDRALQHQAVQKAQKVAGELRLPVPTWAEPPGWPPFFYRGKNAPGPRDRDAGMKPRMWKTSGRQNKHGAGTPAVSLHCIRRQVFFEAFECKLNLGTERFVISSKIAGTLQDIERSGEALVAPNRLSLRGEKPGLSIRTLQSLRHMRDACLSPVAISRAYVGHPLFISESSSQKLELRDLALNILQQQGGLEPHFMGTPAGLYKRRIPRQKWMEYRAPQF